MTLRTVDKLGRIVLPIEMRKALYISTQSTLNVTLTDGKIILQNVLQSCKLCGSSENIVNSHTCTICIDCINNIKKL